MNAPTDSERGIACAPTPEGALVTLWGEIDTALRGPASEAMADLVDRPGSIEIDTAHVSFIDSSGLAFILQLYRMGREERRHVVLRDPSPFVEELLAMIGMTNRIPVMYTQDRPRLSA